MVDDLYEGLPTEEANQCSSCGLRRHYQAAGALGACSRSGEGHHRQSAGQDYRKRVRGAVAMSTGRARLSAGVHEFVSWP